MRQRVNWFYYFWWQHWKPKLWSQQRSTIITFNHRALSLSFASFSPRGLIYPPSSWGKISFTRRIAKQLPLTSLYKSFFNQRPVRLGADTSGSATVTSQLLPMCLCSPESFYPSLFPHLGPCLDFYQSSEKTKKDDHTPVLQLSLLQGKLCQQRSVQIKNSPG